MEKKIAVLVGSLRKESFNKKIANELIRLAPTTLKMEIVEIGNLPLYNEDLDSNPPQQWIEFREKIRNSDAILFVSPEYNRTIPGGLKNAIDVGSRPPGKSVWKGKSGAVVTVTPSATGGLGSNHNIRQAVVFLDVPMMQQPEAYISKVHELLLEDGKTVNEKTETFLKDYMLAFEKWINHF
ncbi:NAD(P)H-dependent oxidoreductase [Kaistella flava (ex Peng et al. 2021)]|uniref:NAD(P)H-dependent oxidoreductase n=1 Tax=Kaistella flava (ex Peng et al. 2021) TaxID=2038776 RepID=A0A7M2Y5X7_9FLAO|nr:NAD(P)H-dependent oxidoreductase [Kaistella flava (ex Peng et al. 2021)]QOW09496.1 NAD(P)H-dependent oxidoreductase [Kaistella flava (ex Peng et al. 2021)]